MMEEKIANYSRYGLPFVFSGKISSFDKLNVHPESHTARATSLTELQVLRYGLDVIVSKIRGLTRVFYYPDAKPITVKVILERESRRIIGGQIIVARR
jgi:NADPH-dependent 2,4-dienoyl-CoA reductase/sulfur reductase-like enzyme